MKTIAAILVETGHPLEIVELELPSLQPGQALVEILYSGVCHTQVLECRGHKGPDPFCPHCLGHEASAVVRDLGPGVTKIKTEEKVTLSWMKGSGADVRGTVYGWNGRTVNAGGVTTFSKLSVVSENRVHKLPDRVSPKAGALLGCAIPTGFGSVFNTAQASVGKSVAVFGVGGIGLCAIAAARLAQCARVVAIDINPSKLALAQKMGAKEQLLLESGREREQLRALSPNGFDIAIEATGRPTVMSLALESVRSQGGIAVIIGNAHHNEPLMLDTRQLNMGKQLRGTWGGDNDPERDFPKYSNFIESGELNIELLIGKTYSLIDINNAIDELEAGTVVRPLIDLQGS